MSLFWYGMLRGGKRILFDVKYWR